MIVFCFKLLFTKFEINSILQNSKITCTYIFYSFLKWKYHNHVGIHERSNKILFYAFTYQKIIKWTLRIILINTIYFGNTQRILEDAAPSKIFCYNKKIRNNHQKSLIVNANMSDGVLAISLNSSSNEYIFTSKKGVLGIGEMANKKAAETTRQRQLLAEMFVTVIIQNIQFDSQWVILALFQI